MARLKYTRPRILREPDNDERPDESHPGAAEPKPCRLRKQGVVGFAGA